MPKGFRATGPWQVRKADGTLVTVADEDGNIDAPVTTTDLTTTGDTILGDGAGDTLVVNGDSATYNTTLTVGVNDAGFDVQLFGATSGAHFLWDESEDTLKLVGGATMDLTGKLNLGLNGGAESASGLLMGVGTTANPATSSTNDDKFIEVRAESTATGGDNRLSYMRYSLGGGGGGECIRAFTKLEAATGTARGAHISLDVATTGSITGLGAGIDGQILVPNQALGGGTYGVINSEIYSAGSSSSVAASNIAFFRAVAGGDTTGAATVDTGGDLFSIQGLTVGSGKLFQVNTAADATHALRIDVGGTKYYVMLTNVGA